MSIRIVRARIRTTGIRTVLISDGAVTVHQARRSAGRRNNPVPARRTPPKGTGPRTLPPAPIGFRCRRPCCPRCGHGCRGWARRTYRSFVAYGVRICSAERVIDRLIRRQGQRIYPSAESSHSKFSQGRVPRTYWSSCYVQLARARLCHPRDTQLPCQEPPQAPLGACSASGRRTQHRRPVSPGPGAGFCRLRAHGGPLPPACPLARRRGCSRPYRHHRAA
jgi:hypothetical protein